MADMQAPTQPVNAAPAAAPPTPPNIAVPAPTPVDVTSGTPQPNQATAIAGSMAPFLAKEQAAAQKESDLANTPSVPPNAPHARLFNIIAAIGAGLSGAGTALATHGKEGGAAEVQEIMGARQQQQQSKVAAAQAQRDAQIRQQQTIADTNARLANNVMLMATLPNELTKRDLDVQTEAQALHENKANFEAQHGGMDADEFHTALHAPGPATGPLGAQVNPFFHNNAVQVYQAGLKVLGADDQFMQDLGKALADKNAKPLDLWSAADVVQKQQKRQEDATDAQVKKEDAQTKQQAANPLFKFESDPKALVEPGAQATLQAYIDDPANKDNLNGLAEAKLLIPKAGIAQKHDQELAAQKAFANKNAEQAANAGDPKIAGAMLANGDLTLGDLKSRGSTPKQIEDAVGAAKIAAVANGKVYNASDEVVGEHALSQPTNQIFYGSARSLIQGGGMLDQLQAAHAALGNTKLPALNTWKNVTEYQAGNPELATYRAALLNSADDAAKVMGGGTPTDALRDLFMQTYAANINNLGFDGAIKQAKDGIASQVKGRIGSNNYIAKREGDILQGQNESAAPPSGKAVSLVAAMALPVNKGKTEAEVRADIQAHGHQVEP